MHLYQVAETSLKEKTYCRNITYRFLVKKTKHSSKHPAVMQEFAYTHRTVFLLPPRKLTENLRIQSLLLFTVYTNKKSYKNIWSLFIIKPYL